jgi:iron complex outermembrane receptor protein
MKMCSVARVAAICWFSAVAANAQTVDLTSISLQDLLDVEISAASKFPQAVTRAPASITVVTAEDIRRFGHRSLADVLGSVRGLYITDDRNYSYTGVRGFGRPGDYNSRVLLLVDGHRLNDPIYDMAPVGADLPIDIEAIDRVEIIRGAGSSLYGTSAFLAVVNVITRTGKQDDRAVVSTTAGSLGNIGARASAGHVFGNGASAVFGGSLQHTDGPEAIYFPEFDAPETSGGIARNSDRQRTARVYGTVTFGAVTLRAAQGDRTKRVPTAAFGTVFGDSRLETRDARGYVDLNYTGPFGRGWRGVARASYDRYHYDGSYPYDYGEDGIQLFEDFARADWLGGEVTAGRRLWRRHFVTVGTEARYSLRQAQYARGLGEEKVYDARRSGIWGGYVQDEVTLTPKLAVTGGLRADYYGRYGAEWSPRAAAVFNPTKASALKVMYGRAFRAPNAYELHYYPSADGGGSLEPETIHTTEAAWEQYYGQNVRSTVSIFRSRIGNLISQTSTDEAFPFANVPGAQSTGMEAEVEARLGTGVIARGSHSWTRAISDDGALPLSNSPNHLTKFEVLLPILSSRLFVAPAGTFISPRLPVRGVELPSTYLQNVTVTADGLFHRLDLSIGVQNLFDRQYGDPGAEEHAQSAIPQDGRTLRATFTYRF